MYFEQKRKSSYQRGLLNTIFGVKVKPHLHKTVNGNELANHQFENSNEMLDLWNNAWEARNENNKKLIKAKEKIIKARKKAQEVWK